MIFLDSTYFGTPSGNRTRDLALVKPRAIPDDSPVNKSNHIFFYKELINPKTYQLIYTNTLESQLHSKNELDGTKLQSKMAVE
jgi:hypothetical protein